MRTGKLSRHIIRFNQLVGEGDWIYHQAALRLGFSDCALWILYTLWEEEGVYTQSGICEMTSLPRQTVNSALKKLVAAGYLSLCPLPSGRSKEVVITPSGRKLMEEVITPVFKAEDRAIEALDEEELKAFLETFEKLNSNLKRELSSIKAGDRR